MSKVIVGPCPLQDTDSQAQKIYIPGNTSYLNGLILGEIQKNSRLANNLVGIWVATRERDMTTV